MFLLMRILGNHVGATGALTWREITTSLTLGGTDDGTDNWADFRQVHLRSRRLTEQP